MNAALHFHNLTLGYERHPAVHHLDGTVARGDLLAVCGPNGAGKSTLLKGIIGSLPPLEGRIERPLCAAREIGYLPQAADIDRSFPIDVFDFVAMGLWREAGLFGSIARRHHPRIHEAIATVGLGGFEDRQIGTLSGGQMQRMLFARLVLQDAPLVLLDEPFAAVDETATRDLLGVVEAWHREGRTIIAVLHDFDMVRRHFPLALLLARECVAWGPARETLGSGNLEKARHMVEAFDRAAHECARAA
jgi:zinc/manganese transport system ATP-binding protein